MPHHLDPVGRDGYPRVVVSLPEDVPGYTRDGDWFVALEEGALTARIRSTAAPRPYGALDQLRVDLRSPRSRPVYLIVFGMLVYGAVMADWLAIGVAGAGILFFGRGFVETIRSFRRGVLTVTRIREIQHEVLKTQGVTEDVMVDGRPMNVGYQLDIVRALLAVGPVAELQVVYDPTSPRPVAHAVAYRRPRDDG